MALSDAALFMDMDLFPLKEEDTSETAMDLSGSSLELVQLLAYEDDVFLDHDHGLALPGEPAGSPATSDDLSDAATDDAASEVSSPPPAFVEDETPLHAAPAVFAWTASAPPAEPSSGGTTAAPPQGATQKAPLSPAPPTPTLAPVVPAMPNVPTAAMLPFAFPVACFPPLNSNLKRPLPDVLPSQPPTAVDPLLAKKTKRELRQMKNRESANRSRLRRKAQLSDLSGEVEELMKKQHELQNIIAGLKAENKSLHDQNAFLRSLVTMYSDPSRAMTLPPVPTSSNQEAASLRSSVSLSDLESGHKSASDSLLEEQDDEEDEDILVLPTQKKQRKSLGRSAATVSAASLGLCASVFGLTILTDSENAAAQSANIRRPGRVLHSLPSSAEQGCSPSPVESLMERVWEVLMSSWSFLTTSELAYGVFLNVLSFVVIMGLYHCFQQYTSSQRTSQKVPRWDNLKMSRDASRRAAASQAKRRSVSWQDVRLEASNGSSEVESSVLPRVQVFT